MAMVEVVRGVGVGDNGEKREMIRLLHPCPCLLLFAGEEDIFASTHGKEATNQLVRLLAVYQSI